MSTGEVVVVGSGITGLIAAHTLQGQGATVTVVDKATRPGGRLSTRFMNGFSVDTGVRSFHVGDSEVLDALTRVAGPALTTEATSKGWRASWTGNAGELAKAMAANLTFTNALVTQILPGPGGVEIVPWASSARLSAPNVLLTMPVPQACLLLQRGGLEPAAELLNVEYEHRLVLLALLEGASDLQATDTHLFDDVELSQSGEYGWLLRAEVTAAQSAQRWGLDITHTLAELLIEASEMLGGSNIVKAECKRWRYATPLHTYGGGSFAVAAQGVLVGGDGFGASADSAMSVERACRSGLDMARQLLS